MRAVDVLTTRVGLSRLLTKKIRLYGALLNNGLPFRMIDLVQAGDQLTVKTAQAFKEKLPIRCVPQLPVVYQDDWLIVINKPAGIVVHPTFKHESGTMTDLLSDDPLHPVSRLDRDTSGLVMIALNGHAHYSITKQTMQKVYWGMIHGRFETACGIIDAPISRDPLSLIKRCVADSGSPSQTKFKTLKYYSKSNVSAVQFELVTGRTHQIRVHCSYLGHPLIGDTLYGHRDDTMNIYDRCINRQALHAQQLCFIHPITKQSICLKAAVPDDIRQLISLTLKSEI